jgi:hypothetical protein
MNLSEFLTHSKPQLPAPRTPGRETGWLAITSFQVSRGSLWVGDPYVVNAEDGFLMDAPNGVYALEAKAMDFAGNRVVSRVRAYLSTAESPETGREIGYTCTDTAMVAVCDIRALDEAIPPNENDAFQDAVMNHPCQGCGVIPIRVGRGFDLPYVSTAFGDTGGTVYEIVSNGARVGFEVEFLPSGYIYNDES